MEIKTGRPKIKQASEKDIPEIIKVEMLTWISSYPNAAAGITENDVRTRFDAQFKAKRATEIGSEINNIHHSYRVIRDNGKIVAYSHLLKEEGFGDLVELYVLPRYQNKGIGGALLKDGLSWLGNKKPIRLEVATYNPAIVIYEHYGFEKRKDLKQSSDEVWNVLPSRIRIPVIIMEKPPHQI